MNGSGITPATLKFNREKNIDCSVMGHYRVKKGAPHPRNLGNDLLRSSIFPKKNNLIENVRLCKSLENIQNEKGSTAGNLYSSRKSFSLSSGLNSSPITENLNPCDVYIHKESERTSAKISRNFRVWSLEEIRMYSPNQPSSKSLKTVKQNKFGETNKSKLINHNENNSCCESEMKNKNYPEKQSVTLKITFSAFAEGTSKTADLQKVLVHSKNISAPLVLECNIQELSLSTNFEKKSPNRPTLLANKMNLADVSDVSLPFEGKRASDVPANARICIYNRNLSRLCKMSFTNSNQTSNLKMLDVFSKNMEPNSIFSTNQNIPSSYNFRCDVLNSVEIICNFETDLIKYSNAKLFENNRSPRNCFLRCKLCSGRVLNNGSRENSEFCYLDFDKLPFLQFDTDFSTISALSRVFNSCVAFPLTIQICDKKFDRCLSNVKLRTNESYQGVWNNNNSCGHVYLDNIILSDSVSDLQSCLFGYNRQDTSRKEEGMDLYQVRNLFCGFSFVFLVIIK